MPAKKKTKKAKARKPKAKKAVGSTGPEETSINEVKRRKECPDCASMNIVFEPENEQLICQDCGSIFEELPPGIGRKYDDFNLF